MAMEWGAARAETDTDTGDGKAQDSIKEKLGKVGVEREEALQKARRR